MKVILDKDEWDKFNDIIERDSAVKFLEMEISKLEQSKHVREVVIYLIGALLSGSLMFNLTSYFDKDSCEIELSKYKVEAEK